MKISTVVETMHDILDHYQDNTQETIEDGNYKVTFYVSLNTPSDIIGVYDMDIEQIERIPKV